MTQFTRRGILAGGAAFVLAACDNSVGSTGGQIIDSRVQNTLSLMYQTYPETQALANRASGMLVMPLIGSAGFMVGGAYGEGALLMVGDTADNNPATGCVSAGGLGPATAPEFGPPCIVA
ncbi:MAG: hypothetical protein AAGC86_17855 [Pseudomonadota bacterium]